MEIAESSFGGGKEAPCAAILVFLGLAFSVFALRRARLCFHEELVQSRRPEAW